MIALDTSALIKRYKREDHSSWVRETMSSDTDWCGSNLLAAETAIAMSRVPQDPDQLARSDSRIARDLEFFDMIPVDGECIVEAIRLGRAFGLRTLDAIHLSAFWLLPPGCSCITFDSRLAEAANEMGLKLLVPPDL
jgi:predicted nucleic acid-binding protein